MRLMVQLNILELQTGKLQGYRLTGTPDFDYLTREPDLFRIYYTDVRVDDHYIYALYADKSRQQLFSRPDQNTMHIYDWNGIPGIK